MSLLPNPHPSKATAYSVPVHRQVAALCHRKGTEGREVLLVTSSEGRWILPKGWPISGLDGHEAALVEAWEEGGVKKAKAAKKPIGTYLDTKISARGDEEPCEIKVYEVKVQKTLDTYPEANRRDRLWLSPKKAAMLVAEEGLRDILLRL